MQTHNNVNTIVSYNEFFVKAALEYWTAMSFPALYFAKYL